MLIVEPWSLELRCVFAGLTRIATSFQITSLFSTEDHTTVQCLTPLLTLICLTQTLQCWPLDFGMDLLFDNDVVHLTRLPSSTIQRGRLVL